MHGTCRLALAAVIALLLAPAAASAAGNGTVQLSSDAYSVEENAGEATITVVRNDPSGHGEVRYGVCYDQSAQPNLDYEPVPGRVDFEDGQREATFHIPIHDDGNVESHETVKLGIYGAYPMQLAIPSAAPDDRRRRHDRERPRPVNPLGLATAPTNGNPLQGARFFVDEEWGLANRDEHSLSHRDPATAAKLQHDRRPARDEALRQLDAEPESRDRDVPAARPASDPARSR